MESCDATGTSDFSSSKSSARLFSKEERKRAFADAVNKALNSSEHNDAEPKTGQPQKHAEVSASVDIHKEDVPPEPCQYMRPRYSRRVQSKSEPSNTSQESDVANHSGPLAPIPEEEPRLVCIVDCLLLYQMLIIIRLVANLHCLGRRHKYHSLLGPFLQAPWDRPCHLQLKLLIR